MYQAETHGVRVTAAPKFMESESSHAQGRYFWAYGSEIVTLVSETVRRWDARTVTDRLESAVGRDLQYIRINGTLVGGLVGLVIHTAEVLM